MIHFVFTNDFSSLLKDTPDGAVDIGRIVKGGKCQRDLPLIIGFSPDHSLTLPQLPVEGIRKVDRSTGQQSLKVLPQIHLSGTYKYSRIRVRSWLFNPHPHWQIWSQNSIPLEVHKNGSAKNISKKRAGAFIWLYTAGVKTTGTYCTGERTFCGPGALLGGGMALTMIVSKRHVQYITQLTRWENGVYGHHEKLTAKYDNLFQVSFPYSAGIHQAPCKWRTLSWMAPALHFSAIAAFGNGEKIYGGIWNACQSPAGYYGWMGGSKIAEQDEVHYKEQTM